MPNPIKLVKGTVRLVDDERRIFDASYDMPLQQALAKLEGKEVIINIEVLD